MGYQKRSNRFNRTRSIARACQQKSQPLLWHAIIIAVCLLLITFYTPIVNAALRATATTYVEHVSLQHTRSVGFEVAQAKRLGEMASEAYKNAEYSMAMRLWMMLAEQGDAEAAYRLAMLYDTGEAGVEQDPAEAASWYLKAAKAGHLHAQHNLAVAYVSGDGVEMDISKALSWWKRAARTGNSDSQYNLGIVYAMGVHGVKKNLDKAKKWWRMAAMKGDPMAQYNLGTIYANGEGHVRSYCEAMRWWEKSAQRGVEQASWALEVIQTRQDYLACW
jgi:TPR repeat protein